MARAAANRRLPPVSLVSLDDRAELLRGLIGMLSLAAMQFVSQAKVNETVRHWLADGRAVHDKEHDVAAVGEVLALAMDVALFTPSATGTTAVDRFARQHLRLREQGKKRRRVTGAAAPAEPARHPPPHRGRAHPGAAVLPPLPAALRPPPPAMNVAG